MRSYYITILAHKSMKKQTKTITRNVQEKIVLDAIKAAATFGEKSPDNATLALATGLACYLTFKNSLRRVPKYIKIIGSYHSITDDNETEIDGQLNAIDKKLRANLKATNLPASSIFDAARAGFKEVCDTAQKSKHSLMLENCEYSYEVGLRKNTLEKRKQRNQAVKFARYTFH